MGLATDKSYIRGMVEVRSVNVKNTHTHTHTTLKWTMTVPVLTVDNLQFHHLFVNEIMLFLTFSIFVVVLVANPKKRPWTVANPARGLLLNREMRRKRESLFWQHTPSPPCFSYYAILY